jgi:hypothetical protein
MADSADVVDFYCYDGDTIDQDGLPAYRRGPFPQDAVGVAEWEALVARLPTLTPADGQEDPLANLRRLHQRRSPSHPLRRCPRVFVSHRRADALEALRIAYLATRQRFAFWLDVLSPNLATVTATTFAGTPYQQAVLTAAVIEMGLLNCTHVIAAITDHTPGTMWVPYEYGRVKDSAVTSVQVACWLDPRRTASGVPEYMLLGAQHENENDIDTWFTNALMKWPMGAGCLARAWPHPIPPRLP